MKPTVRKVKDIRGRRVVGHKAKFGPVECMRPTPKEAALTCEHETLSALARLDRGARVLRWRGHVAVVAPTLEGWSYWVDTLSNPYFMTTPKQDREDAAAYPTSSGICSGRGFAGSAVMRRYARKVFLRPRRIRKRARHERKARERLRLQRRRGRVLSDLRRLSHGRLPEVRRARLPRGAVLAFTPRDHGPRRGARRAAQTRATLLRGHFKRPGAHGRAVHSAGRIPIK